MTQRRPASDEIQRSLRIAGCQIRYPGVITCAAGYRDGVVSRKRVKPTAKITRWRVWMSALSVACHSRYLGVLYRVLWGIQTAGGLSTIEFAFLGPVTIRSIRARAGRPKDRNHMEELNGTERLRSSFSLRAAPRLWTPVFRGVHLRPSYCRLGRS